MYLKVFDFICTLCASHAVNRIGHALLCCISSTVLSTLLEHSAMCLRPQCTATLMPSILFRCFEVRSTRCSRGTSCITPSCVVSSWMRRRCVHSRCSTHLGAQHADRTRSTLSFPRTLYSMHRQQAVQQLCTLTPLSDGRTPDACSASREADGALSVNRIGRTLDCTMHF